MEYAQYMWILYKKDNGCECSSGKIGTDCH